VTLAVVTSPRWRNGVAAGDGPVRRAAAVTVGIVFLQLLVGAVLRHTKAGLAIPDFPLAFGRLVPPIASLAVAIHFAHRVTAVAVAIAAAACFARARRTDRADLRRLAVGLCALVTVQIALGAATVLSKKDVVVTTLHVVTGALVLGTSLVLALASRRTQVAAARNAASRAAAALSLAEEPAWK